MTGQPAFPVNTYQVKKMYDAQEISNFGTADTKLKQLQLKLIEHEQQKHQLHLENMELRRMVKNQDEKCPVVIADNIEERLVTISKMA